MSKPTTVACGCKPYSPCDQHQSASDAIEARTDQNTCTCGLDQFKAIRFRVFCPKHDGWAEGRAGLDVDALTTVLEDIAEMFPLPEWERKRPREKALVIARQWVRRAALKEQPR